MPPTHTDPTLVAHMAALSGAYRRNSIAAIRECIDHRVPRIEIDIHSLDGDDYVVTHDRKLEEETTGRGSVGGLTPDAVRAVPLPRRSGRPSRAAQRSRAPRRRTPRWSSSST